MKKIISWTLLLAMLLGMFAGCGSTQTPATDPVTVDPTVAEVQPDDNLAGAIAYLKAMYKEASDNTPADFERTAVVRVANIPYAVVWSTNVGEDTVKIIPGEKSVSIDINETVTADTPYTLTATITGTDGTTATASWDHFIPASLGSDYGAIVDMGYALEEGAALDGMATLAGVITSIDTPYDAGYKNITVTIQVEGREDKPIMCYRLKGEGAADLWIGDFITVKGTLKNYKGTIEFDAGCELVSVVKGENEKPVAPEDPAEILKAAYALSHGESLPYECTLTGVIVFVNAVYNPQYDNITVSMMVGDKGVRCFRLKGEGVDTLNINDTITVTGTLMNYNGIIEFNAGCTLDDVIQREAPQQPKDPKDVVDAAYALEPGFYLAYYPTLTGTITKINEAYNAQFGNITVTMVVAGREDKPIKCYRMSGAGADTLEVGDTITVKGYMVNYEGKNGNEIEYSKPALLKVVKAEKPVEPEIELPPADSVLTLAQAQALGDSISETTPYKYYVSGTITGFYGKNGKTYGNVWIKDANGDSFLVYGLYSADGSIRYDKMETKPVEGDFITAYGAIGQYNGKGQMVNGWMTEFVPAGGTTEPSEPTEPETPDVPAPDSTLTLAQANAFGVTLSDYTTDKYYVSGTITGFYGKSGTTYGNVWIKDANGDTFLVYGLYTTDGVRYDKMETKPVEGDTITAYGVIGQYNGTAQMKNGTLVSHTPAPPAADSTLTLAQANAFGVTLSDYTTDKYYVSGTITGFYGKSGKTYGNVWIQDSNGDSFLVYGLYTTDGVRYDKMETKPVEGDTITAYGVIGQYNGTAQMKNGTLISHIPAGGTTEPSEPEATEPETPDVPAADSTLSLAQANALGVTLSDYTTDKYYVSGTITGFYGNGGKTYGNVWIKDANGDTFLVYGLYTTDGVRYDKMETKPVEGDTITAYGVIGQYNGTAQMKNGTLVSHTPAGGTTEPSEPTEPEATEPETPDVPELNASSSLAEIMAYTQNMEKGTYLDFTITVTGTVNWIGTPSATKGITLALDNGVECYRMKGEGYTLDDYKLIALGDTITASGIPGRRSKGSYACSLKEGCTLVSWVDNTP